MRLGPEQGVIITEGNVNTINSVLGGVINNKSWEKKIKESRRQYKYTDSLILQLKVQKLQDTHTKDIVLHYL